MQKLAWLSQIVSRGWQMLSRSGEGLVAARVGRAGRRVAGSSVGGGGHSGGAGTPSKLAGTGRRRSRRGGSMPVGGNNQGAAFEIKLLNETLPTYEIRQVIDQGGQGTVYRAIQKSTGRTCALKVLHFDPHATQQRHHRFEREVSLLSRLRHPNVVTIYECGLAGNRPYLSMELIDGLPIDDYILFNRPSIEQCVALFEKICRAVATVHQRGVIHRDLKPSNILVDLEGEPHILDFGLAKCFDEDAREQSISMAGQMIGTLPYQSPEQVSAEGGDPDTRSDVYALGVILHELLTGEMPYSVDGPPVSVQKNILGVTPGPLARRGESESETCAVGPISIDLSHVVLKALSKEPDRRYQSADALADDLRRCMKGEAISARGDSGWYQFRKTMRKYRVHTAIAASFAVVLATSAVVSTVLWRRAEQNARASQASLFMASNLRQTGELQDQGRTEQAIGLCKEALEIGAQIRNPDFGVLRMMYSANRHLARFYLDDPSALSIAKSYCMEALRYSDLIQRKYPDHPDSVRIRASAHDINGRVLLKEKKWSEANSHFDDGIFCHQQLAELEGGMEGSVVEFDCLLLQQNKARACMRMGKQGRLEALGILGHARDAYIRLCAAAPKSTNYAIELIRTESLMGQCLLLEKRFRENLLALQILTTAQGRVEDFWMSDLAQNRRLEVGRLSADLDANTRLAQRRLTSKPKPY